MMDEGFEIDLVRVLEPQNYMRLAVEFYATGDVALDGWEAREEKGNLHFRTNYPIYFLFLHAAELGLKAYLVYRGVASFCELRKKYGHDLRRLVKFACTSGLPDDHKNLTNQHLRAICELSSTYKGKCFEYYSGTGFLRHWEWIRECVRLLLCELSRVVGPSIPTELLKRTPVPKNTD